MHPWDRSETPWYQLHIDHAAPFKNMFLIIVDAHSKWSEVFQMISTTTSAIVKNLRTLFVRQGQGMPNEVDNSPQFISAELKQFMALDGIRHNILTVPPAHQ